MRNIAMTESYFGQDRSPNRQYQGMISGNICAQACFSSVEAKRLPMRSVSGIASRWLLTFLVAAASCIHTVPAWTQTPQNAGHVDPESAPALQLYEIGTILEAISML